MYSIGILGGTGYIGKELIVNLVRHPFVSKIQLYSKGNVGSELYDLFPDLSGQIENHKTRDISLDKFDEDIYFISLPAGMDMEYVPKLLSNNKLVIDLGGDYRLDYKELYAQWYHLEHTSAYLLGEKVYGLADYKTTDYTGKKLIANPGCYPTAILLSILPLFPEFADNIVSVSCVASSGTSGAGKSMREDLLLSEMYGNVKAYNVNQHRHEPEILQQLYKHGFHSPFSFTPQILPVKRGIYVTISVHLNEEIDKINIESVFYAAYSHKPFVRLRNLPPELRWVINTNFCDISISVNKKLLIINTAIDNLIKGGAGQAIQNMNNIFGWEETTGLLKKELKYA